MPTDSATEHVCDENSHPELEDITLAPPEAEATVFVRLGCLDKLERARVVRVLPLDREDANIYVVGEFVEQRGSGKMRWRNIPKASRELRDDYDPEIEVELASGGTTITRQSRHEGGPGWSYPGEGK